jgi:hypothetical protein
LSVQPDCKWFYRICTPTGKRETMRTLSRLWKTPIEKLSVVMILLVIGIFLSLFLRSFVIALVGGPFLCGLLMIWYRMLGEETAIYYLKRQHGHYTCDANTPQKLYDAFVRLERKHRVTINNHDIILLDLNTPCMYDKFVKRRRKI